MKYTNFPLFFAVPLLSIIATGCGSSSSSSSSTGGGAVSSVSIANLPSASSMITTNSSSSNFSPRSGEPYTIHSVRSVSGTAPVLSSITNTNVDTYFWNGLLTFMAKLSQELEVWELAKWPRVLGSPLVI